MLPDYTQLEEMLFRGFLTSSVMVGSIPVILKTLNQRERSLISLYCAGGTEQERLAYLLAFSTFLFNRVNVLGSRDEHIGILVPEYAKLPSTVHKELLQHLSVLNTRAARLLKSVRAYTYGSESSQNWNLFKNLALCDTRCTGIQGTENMGMNTHQSLWKYYHEMDSVDDNFQRDWSLAKFMTSVHSSKGVQKLDQKDRQNKEDELARRRAAYLSQGKDSLGDKREIWVSEDSPSELLDQIERTMAGQKDFHDQVIEEHERKQKARYEAWRAEEAQRRDLARVQREEWLGDVTAPLVVYTKEEAERKSIEYREEKRLGLASGRYRDTLEETEQHSNLRRQTVIEDHYEEVVDNIPSDNRIERNEET